LRWAGPVARLARPIPAVRGLAIEQVDLATNLNAISPALVMEECELWRNSLRFRKHRNTHPKNNKMKIFGPTPVAYDHDLDPIDIFCSYSFLPKVSRAGKFIKEEHPNEVMKLNQTSRVS
jgi:hypothetical protein